MLKQFLKILFIPLILSSCFNSTENDVPNTSLAVIRTIPETVNLEIDTKSINQGSPSQEITFTNIGRQPVTQFVIKGFKDESAPIIQTTTCDKDLAVGGSCEVKLELATNYKLAASSAVSRSTVMMYEYNDASGKKIGKLAVNFKIEKWIGSVYLTNTSTSGRIVYQRSEDLPAIKAGADSADYYCRFDKNNPQNGYEYKALIYDTTNRTPYLNWVLFGGNTYYSVMPDTYHQKVWKTAYNQATTDNLLASVSNCISTNCIDQSGGDETAWIGMSLNNNLMNMDTCGTAGNAWKSEQNKFHAQSFAIQHEQDSHFVTMLSNDASCDLRKKIICVSM